MKVISTLLLITCLLGCTGFDDCVPEQETIRSEQLWKYPLGGYPTEGFVRVEVTPKNSVLSEIAPDTINGGQSYYYRSMPDFVGVEEIEIVSGYSSGDSNFRKTTLCLRLTITPE